MSIGPNTCYWPPSSGNGPHLHPDQVNYLTPEEMQDPFLAARWVTRTEFHDLVRKGRQSRRRAAKLARAAALLAKRLLVPNVGGAVTMAVLPLMRVTVGQAPAQPR